jgi:homoserine kinase type II
VDDASAIRRHVEANWDLSDVVECDVLRGGLNNRAWRIVTTRGGFSLRVYQNISEPRGLELEHRVLAGLAERPLPFRVPAPLATRDGRTWAQLDSDRLVLTSLAAVIPGEHPELGDLGVMGALGEALGVLDAALAELCTDPLEVMGPHLDSSWETDLAALELGDVDTVRLRALGEELNARVPPLYTELPVQVVHNDFVGSNTLMLDGRVSGILDFEFASVDLRVFDLASAVGEVCLLPALDRGLDVWPRLEYFARGFARSVHLVRDELQVIPLLIRDRALVVSAHWLRRWRDGSSDSGVVAQRQVERAVRIDRWLMQNERELVARLGAVYS